MTDYLSLGQWVELGLDWLLANLAWLFDAVSNVIGALVAALSDVLIETPYVVTIAVFALIAWLLRSWQLALGTALAFLFIAAKVEVSLFGAGIMIGLDMWTPAMQTMALVLVAAIIAVLIAVPLGIWSARNDAVRAALKPVLDFMQTMPAFVYLIPAIMFFGIGVVPGVVATVIFALPPGVRLTELGIRGVDSETVEAGHAFGATPGQILRGVQLPLALPTIMAGINQLIMLALSMAVIAGMAGADGLGKLVVQAISSMDIPLGVEAGVGIVLIAVFLDRCTAALAQPSPSSLLGLLEKRRQHARRQEAADAAAAASDTAELAVAAGPRRAAP